MSPKVLAAECLSPFTASRIDEISLRVGDVVCIYHQIDKRWAEGHNITQDSFGSFPIDNMKAIDVLSYQRLTPNQIKIKTVDNLFANSDSEHEATFYAFHMDYQAHLDVADRIKNIITELRKEESTFIDQLFNFIETIIDPLLSEMWFPKEYHEFLYTIKEIHGIHSSLGRALVELTQGTKLSKVLVQFSKDFKNVYAKYASLLPQASTMGRKYGSKGQMITFLRSRHSYFPSDPAVFLKFIAFLYVPFQRRRKIFSYLRRILQLIPVDHADFHDLLSCWKSFKVTISVLEEVLNRSESVEELSGIQSRLRNYTGPLLSGLGLIVLKGNFRVKCGRRHKNRMVYLVEKGLLVFESKDSISNNGQDLSGKSYAFRDLTLDKVVPLDSEHFRTIAAWDTYDKNAFRIVYINSNGNTQFMELWAPTKNISEIWISEIRRIGEQNSSKKFRNSLSLSIPSIRSDSIKSSSSSSSRSMDSTAGNLDVESLSNITSFQSLEPSNQISPNSGFDIPNSPLEDISDVRSHKMSQISAQISPETSDYVASLPPNRGFESFGDFMEDLDDFDIGLNDSEVTRTPPTSICSGLEDFDDGEEVELAEADFYADSDCSDNESMYSRSIPTLSESLDAGQRITRREFKSLYNSLQVKVQEYLDLKDRIDRISYNLNKM